MIVDDIREYLSKKKITFEEYPSKIEGIESKIEKHSFTIRHLMKHDMTIHDLFKVEEYAAALYAEMKRATGLNLQFIKANYANEKTTHPKIVCITDQEPSTITVQTKDHTYHHTGTYIKEIEIEVR